MIAQVKQLLRGDLKYLAFGGIISHMGDRVYWIGLSWLVLELTGSESAVGSVYAISSLPILLFGVFGGVVADMWNRRTIMLVADGLRALVVLMIPFMMLKGTMDLNVIYILTFILSVGTAFFDPARDAMIPDMVRKEHLLAANSLAQLSFHLALLLGSTVVALVLKFTGLESLFYVDSGTFLVSFVAIWMIRYGSKASEAGPKVTAVGHLRDVIRLVMKDRRLRFLLILTSANNFFIMGPALVGTPVFVKFLLKGGAGDYALSQAALGAGMLAGLVLVNVAGRNIGKGRLLLSGMMFDGLTHAVLYFCNSTLGLSLVIGFHAIGIPFIMVPRAALLQEWVEPEMRGRVFGLLGTAVVGTTAISCFVTGYIAEGVPINIVFAVFGTCAALCSVLGWLHTRLRDS